MYAAAMNSAEIQTDVAEFDWTVLRMNLAGLEMRA
jgi:hypothetical protein